MQVGQYIIDGSVVWILADSLDGDMVGDISFHPTLLDGHIKGNRANVTASDYPRLVAWALDNNMITSDSTDESKYLYDAENDELTLPNVMYRLLQGDNAVGIKEAGLPNITGKIYTSQDDISTGVNGAFTVTNEGTGHTHYAGGASRTINLDASQSNAIYGNSQTVQPPAITLIPQIKY